MAWLLAQLLDWPRLGHTTGTAFLIFTACAAGVCVLLVVLGNSPKQRAIRSDKAKA